MTISCRIIIQILGGTIAVLTRFCQSGCTGQPGIVTIQNHGRILSTVPSEPEEEQWVYHLAAPFQISATEMGLMVNIRRGSVKTIDLEVGNDLLIYDGYPLEKPKRFLKNQSRPSPNLGTGSFGLTTWFSPAWVFKG